MIEQIDSVAIELANYRCFFFLTNTIFFFKSYEFFFFNRFLAPGIITAIKILENQTQLATG